GGAPQTSSTNQITTIATGLTVTLKGVTASPASVTVAQSGANSDGVQDALKNFVSVYNDTVTAISNKLNEKKVANPQTDADRAQGDLSGNSSLSSLLNQLREGVTTAFAGAPAGLTTLSQAGLSTGAAVGTGTLNQNSIDGLLELDTDQLSTKLASNF